MIFIPDGTKTNLPKKHHFANNVCAYIYDQMGEIMTSANYKEMLGTNIDYNEDEAFKTLFEENGVHPIDALKISGRNAELEIVLTKHIVMSLISDMLNFLYEAIVIAQKGKMSVAYSLLRKPFTDQLLMLEQILIDRKDFIDRFFHNGDPNTYDPSSNKIDKRKIIEEAVQKLNSKLFSADLIYELRYDKSSKSGINWITNHALHIVTKDKNYKTENQNLNFIFSVNDDLEKYWDHFFYIVSMLLIYTAAITDKIIFNLIDSKSGLKELKHLERFIGFAMLFDDPTGPLSKMMFKLLRKVMVTECPICKNVNRFSKRDYFDFFFARTFLCKKCHNSLQASTETILCLNYIFEREENKSNEL